MSMIHTAIKVNGLVQGIGFRPFIAELAEKLKITGTVRNAGGIVFIEAYGEADAVRRMLNMIRSSPPPGAMITGIDVYDSGDSPSSKSGTDISKKISGPGETDYEIPKTFRIIRSTFDQEPVRVIPPDIATCPDCERELKDPANRRYHYPFISCTKCGPRFTIMSKVPYDREFTTMKDFPLCDACRAEYVRFGDIRRHGQTICCADCGPHMQLFCGPENAAYKQNGKVSSGRACEESGKEGPFRKQNGENYKETDSGESSGKANRRDEAVMLAACDMLEAGKVLAVKNVGGFHFACRADSAGAVGRLRTYKRRPRKQLAVMLRDLDTVKQYCFVSDKEAELLTSPARPIVLLDLKEEVLKRGTFSLVTDSLRLGVMLPSDPILILLAERFECLVMTSGNLSGEPMLASNEQIRSRVTAGFPDAALLHNRRILYPLDDSIVQTICLGGEERVQIIRRARGYVPFGITMDRAGWNSMPKPVPETMENRKQGAAWNRPVETEQAGSDADSARQKEQAGNDVDSAVQKEQAGPNADLVRRKGRTADSAGDVLACGADVKGGFALLSADEVIPGGHFPDLTGKSAFVSWRRAMQQVVSIFEAKPEAVLSDMHPEYHSARFAEEFARSEKIPIYRIQHHKAHAMSVAAENGLREPTLDIVLDGTGYGEDGTIWGGEFFVSAKRRAGHLRQIVYQGRNDIARKAEKAGLCILKSADGRDDLVRTFPAQSTMGEAAGNLVLRAVDAGINTFASSSCGRIFDGMAGLLGIISESSYEGEAAEMLQDEAERYLRNTWNPGTDGAFSGQGGCPADESLFRETGFFSNKAVPGQNGRSAGRRLSESKDRVPEEAEKPAEYIAADSAGMEVIDTAGLAADLLDAYNKSDRSEKDREVYAWHFIRMLSECIVKCGERIMQKQENPEIHAVTLSGGCMQNRLLLKLLWERFEADGYRVYMNHKVPAGDGGIALGQEAYYVRSISGKSDQH